MHDRPLRVAVTGASGFIGRVLVPILLEARFDVVPLVRDRGVARKNRGKSVPAELCQGADWCSLLADVDVVIHLAGIAHEIGSPSSTDEYRVVNVDGSRQLGLQAVDAGVKRLIFLSSIKVHGERTEGKPFSVADGLNPQDAYASSKAEAETILREIATESSLEVVIIRPPLVYGPRMKGNLRALSGLIKRGVPIPLGGIRNQRDLIGAYNLCDLILTCIEHPAAAGKTFLACDGEPLSTVDLVRHLSRGAGRRARLVYVPRWILAMVASFVGKQKVYEKVSSDLRIDMGETQKMLGWSPPYSVEECFRRSFILD